MRAIDRRIGRHWCGSVLYLLNILFLLIAVASCNTKQCRQRNRSCHPKPHAFSPLNIGAGTKGYLRVQRASHSGIRARA
jgi:hypothetical protein